MDPLEDRQQQLHRDQRPLRKQSMALERAHDDSASMGRARDEARAHRRGTARIRKYCLERTLKMTA